MACCTNYPHKLCFTQRLRLQFHFPPLQDSVHCALEMSRLQLEDWKNMGPRAHEEALIQKALLQEDLVTVRARMCDVSLVCTDSQYTDSQTTDMSMYNVCRLWIIVSTHKSLIRLFRKWRGCGVSTSEWRVNCQ